MIAAGLRSALVYVMVAIVDEGSADDAETNVDEESSDGTDSII